MYPKIGGFGQGGKRSERPPGKKIELFCPPYLGQHHSLNKSWSRQY